MNEIKKIRSCRIESGITLKELSKETGIDTANLSRIERGENTSIKTLTKILDTLELKIVITNK